MTPLRIKLGLSVPLLALLFLCGCPQKKQPAAAPVAPPEASPTPVATPTPQAEPSVTAPAQTPDQTDQAAAEKQPEKKPAKRHPIRKPAQEKPAVQEAKNSAPPRPDAAAQPSPPTIAPAPGAGTPGRDQAATDQLLQTAQNNLNNIKRDLSQDEKDMVTQIKAFITQSRDATKNNDQVRAYTLANKARLLSDALVKP